MLNTIKLNQIVNNNGLLTIDVFKNNINDNSKLQINCNGINNDSIKINSLKGGIFIKSKNNIKLESTNIDLYSYKKINVFSDSVLINSNKIIKLGSIESNIIINNDKNFITINTNQYENSFFHINSNNIFINNNNKSISLNNNCINILSNNVINFGSTLNNIIKINLLTDEININGNVSINGKVKINKSLIKYKTIKNIISKKSLIFNLNENPDQNWSIYSIDINKNKKGLFYNDNFNLIEFKNNEKYLNIFANTITLNSNNSLKYNSKYLFNINDQFTIDKKYNLNMNGSLNVKNNFNLKNLLYNKNDNIHISTNLIIDNLNIKNLFQFTVGKNFNFIDIQECINYIELNNLFKNNQIFILIYPDKIYKEDIIIKNKNINLIGQYVNVLIHGNINVQSSSFLLIKNITFCNTFNKTFIFNSEELKLINTKFLENKHCNIKFNIKNTIIAKFCYFDNLNTNLKTENLYIYQSYIKTNLNISSSNITFNMCKINFKDQRWVINSTNIIRIINTNINNIKNLYLQCIKRNIHILIQDCSLNINNNKYFPRLILKPLK